MFQTYIWLKILTDNAYETACKVSKFLLSTLLFVLCWNRFVFFFKIFYIFLQPILLFRSQFKDRCAGARVIISIRGLYWYNIKTLSKVFVCIILILKIKKRILTESDSYFNIREDVREKGIKIAFLNHIITILIPQHNLLKDILKYTKFYVLVCLNIDRKQPCMFLLLTMTWRYLNLIPIPWRHLALLISDA